MKRNLVSILALLVCIVTFAQKQPIEVSLEDKNSFSLVLYPDPQTYIKFDVNQPIFDLMTAWTAHNIEKLNIKSVLCTGDMVEQNDRPVPEMRNGNQTSIEQWKSVSRAYERLDNLVPYIVCTGNHDYGYTSAENRHSKFPEYFYPERNNKMKKVLVSVCENWLGHRTLENAAYEIEGENWSKILVVTLEFAPRDEAINWAKKLVDSKTYKDHKVILLTHAYLSAAGKRHKSANYKISPANYGEAIWEKLVNPSTNIGLVLCGHAANATGEFETNVSYTEDKKANGKIVPQMMFNAQTAGGGWHGNGGDGWLRILEFMPDGKTVSVRTFSPFFSISPTTAQHSWRTGEKDQFKFVIE